MSVSTNGVVRMQRGTAEAVSSGTGSGAVAKGAGGGFVAIGDHNKAEPPAMPPRRPPAARTTLLLRRAPTPSPRPSGDYNTAKAIGDNSMAIAGGLSR